MSGEAFCAEIGEAEINHVECFSVFVCSFYKFASSNMS